MTLSRLSHILGVFTGAPLDEEGRNALVKEALLMTLARASSADSNIHPVEVDTVRKIVKRETGEDVSAADVKVAARSELFERESLERCLRRIGHRLDDEDRALIAQSLAEVIASDVRVTDREVEFFNRMATALRVSPAQLAGLIPD
jgi:uncharacterized tellurite resistance protein B-like protein